MATKQLNTCETCQKQFPKRSHHVGRFCSDVCRYARTPEQIFWSRVRKTATCWFWTGKPCPTGYGQMKIGGRKGRVVLTHRFSYELHNGQIPKGEGFHGWCVCHTCDNPLCVNPKHLFLGTQADNLADMKSKGRANRTDKARGEDNSKAKLTKQQVITIRASTDSQRACAKRFGVSQSQIGSIRRDETWTHVK